MSEWKQRRFWDGCSVSEETEGFAVRLDQRILKTPAKATLLLPTRDLAAAVAAEWAAQKDVVDPQTMPMTRTANSAIDRVAPQLSEVADMLAAYGDSDLLCYRADSPQELVARQAAQWDPPLDWAADTLGARLEPRTGVIHAAQPPEAVACLARHVHEMTAFQIAAFHDLVALSGSLVLGFAAVREWRDLDTIWQISRLDELWQEEQWGPDSEAQLAADIKKAAFLHAGAFFAMC